MLKGMPTQMLVTMVPTSAVSGALSQALPASSGPRSMKKLTTPYWPVSIHRNRLPVTTSGSIHPSSISARSRPWPGTRG